MQLFTNNADSALNGAIAEDTTTITLTTGDGSKFPSPSGGDFFLVTLFQKLGAAETNHEIVKCTARAGDVLTVVRAQEGTTAKAFNNADPVELRVTAGTLASKADTASTQASLVSGTNIKTINSASLLGAGNVSVEPTITAGTTAQYWRGDKSWQTLDKTAVGLGNVDNTSDANKPISTATQTALNAKVNKSGDAMTGALTLASESIPLTVNNLPALRPSLLLDFANSRSVDPRITFTRASTATRTNSKGLIESVSSNVPRIDFDPVTGECKGLLIEEQRTNLLTHTNNINSSTWAIGSNTVFAVEGISLVDGSSYYYSIRSTGIAGNLFALRTFTAPATGTYTASAWVKVDNATLAASSARLISLIIDGDNTRFLSYAAAGLVAGVWKRVSYSFIANSGSTVNFNFGFDFSTNTSVKLYFCHPQVEAGSFPTSYIPSSVTFTGRASTGTYIGSDGLIKTAASGAPRLSYNPNNLSVAPALLLETAATNLLTYSEQFDNAAWTKARTTISANATTAPDGTMTADKLVEDTATGVRFIEQVATTVSGTAYTFSVYVKAVERSRVNLTIYTNTATSVNFDLSAGTILSGSGTITPVGFGWFKVTHTHTSGFSGVGYFSIYVQSASGSSYTGDGTSGLYIWGAQVEAGSFPTSYIPTTTAQVTRAADTSTSAATTRAADVASMTGTNFSSWYRQDEGAFVAEADYAGITSYARVFEVNDGTSNNLMAVLAQLSTGKWIYASALTNGVFQLDTASSVNDATLNSPFKAALAYKPNDTAFQFNTNAVAAGTFYTPPSVTQLRIGNATDGVSILSGHIRRLAYYPKRLTNTELQAVTTP